MRRRLLITLVASCLAFTASVAAAQATVVVLVRKADGTVGDAEVVLTSGGTSHRCTTHQGTCRIAGVAAGMYVVTARPISDGRAPLPREVPVTPEGSVEVFVRLR